MGSSNLLNMDDLADIFSELDNIEEVPEEMTPEEIASQKRYEEIIKKHKHDNDQQ